MLPPPLPSGRGAPGPSARSDAAPVHPDDAIRATDDDAAVSRLSAVHLGYLVDPYASLVYKVPRLGPAGLTGPGGGMRKAPLINVGTHHRTAALDAVVDSFIAAGSGDGGKVQIVSLGAGSDTRFWRLAERNAPVARYVEVDFPHLTAMKAQRIARSRTLAAALTPAPSQRGSAQDRAYSVSHGGAALTAGNYALVPLDLRTDSLDELLPFLDTALPTLLLADDAFGRVMHRNLALRNLSLPGSVFGSLNDQAGRFTDPRLGNAAFDASGAKSLWDVRGDLPKAELARISKLEILDEIEELRLVLSHYCVVWASKGERMQAVGL
ncbi:hypothetical protein CspeluHIS016_0503440 [Cutaneotrichosporon spelunceum]|uniref:Leucine carboxyl methyltransferase 1 n=1 Tax=Cutaneotrichosporon spelunceum TaxID=1672016 RepID=A0AAD3YDU3_9TREE|nr:hypothetical protein CspeluHIS016_0503440 [Cutaneotrichosporon spelunceum]